MRRYAWRSAGTHSGVVSFVNAVLRNLERCGNELRAGLERTSDPIDRISVLSSHPRWLVARWARRWGLDAAWALCAQNNEEASIDLRANLRQIGSRAAEEALAAAGISAERLDTRGGFRLAETSAVPRALEIDAQGFRAFFVQSRLSQIAAESAAALALQAIERRDAKGAIVVDACAAPGGKSLVLDQTLPDEVRLLAYR